MKEDTKFLIETEKNLFKMVKAKATLYITLSILTLTLIFAITDAYPTTTTPSTLSNFTHLGNNSRLVITNVVKTIEFEVGILDDDGTIDDNTTAVNGTNFYETNIEVLNLGLLKELVNQAEKNRTEEMDDPEVKSNVELEETKEKTMDHEHPTT